MPHLASAASWRFLRILAVAALPAAVLVAAQPAPARAAEAPQPQIQLAQADAAPAAPAKKSRARRSRAETVETRIAGLHTSLKITQDEEPAWSAVAQTMRDNAAAMDKLVQERRTKGAQNMTALDDLQTYQAFAQAHLDGLQKLNASFKTLYDAMPDDQKKVTDQVFRRFGRNAGRRQGG